MLISSRAVVGVSSGALQVTLSRKAGAIPSGRLAGDQCAWPATRCRLSVLSGLSRANILPSAKFDFVGRDVERWRCDAGELVAQANGGEMRRAHRRRRKAAGIIAGGDRPSVLLGVGLEIDDHIFDVTPSWSATIWASAV